MNKTIASYFWLLQILIFCLLPAQGFARKKPTAAPQLLPPTAPVMSAHIDVKLDKQSLSIDELESLIDGFEATIVKKTVGRNKKETSQAVIFGQVFPECLEHLQPVAHDNPNENKGGCANTVGFEFLDNGGKFKKCVKRHQEKHETCEILHCTSLSQLDAFSINLKDNYDSHVGFKHMYTNNLKDVRSKDRFQCEDFPEAALIHESVKVKEIAKKEAEEAKELSRRNEEIRKYESEELEQKKMEAENEEAEKQKHFEKIDYLKRQICDTCNTQKELENAIQANKDLRLMQQLVNKFGIEALSPGEFEKNQKQFEKNKQQLHEGDLTRLFAEIASAPLEQLEGIRDRLLEWAKVHPKDAEKVALLGLRALGERLINSPQANPDTFEAASEIFEHVRKITNNPKAKSELAKKIEELKILRVVSMAQFGLQRNKYNFTREYTHLLQETEKQAWRVCYGLHANLEECAEVLKVRGIVRGLPQIAQAADAQGIQAQIGLQQALNPQQFGPAGVHPTLPGAPGAIQPALPINPLNAMHPGMNLNSMYAGGIYPGMSPGMSPLGGAYPNPGMVPMNPLNGGIYPGTGVPPMGGMPGYPYNQMPGGYYGQMGGAYNQMGNMQAYPYSGGYNQMDAYNQLPGGYNQMGGMPGYPYNPMAGGYNPMNPMMPH